jgi:hypothetical protein
MTKEELAWTEQNCRECKFCYDQSGTPMVVGGGARLCSNIEVFGGLTNKDLDAAELLGLHLSVRMTGTPILPLRKAIPLCKGNFFVRRIPLSEKIHALLFGEKTVVDGDTREEKKQ